MRKDFEVIVVGGGLAGLTATIALAKAGRRVALLEKRTYPYHKVCGEYVSNEVLGYLQHLGFNPFRYGATRITKLRISSPSGRNIYAPLDLGAFGLSRYVMDAALAELAVQAGATVLTHTRVTDIQFGDSGFTVATQNGDSLTSSFVIGSWGKRETLDKRLQRTFMSERTSFMGVKYHLRTDYPADEIGLDNFSGGYNGIARVEDGRYNVCSFYRRPADKSRHSSVASFREQTMYRNPVIRNLFENADFLLEEPVVINEICFSSKKAVEQHILMCGDSAGLITPLCGNGMSMAITAAKLATDLLLNSTLLDQPTISMAERSAFEQRYQHVWSGHFSRRLFWGRAIQRVFGHPLLTAVALKTVHAIPPLERSLIKATHGAPLAF